MNNNKEPLYAFSPEEFSRINAIDLSDPNSIAAINSIDNTIAKLNSRDDTIAKLNSHTFPTSEPTRIVQDCKIVLNTIYGRMRWILVYNNDTHIVEKELQQQVTTQYMGEPSVTEWRTVETENM